MIRPFAMTVPVMCAASLLLAGCGSSGEPRVLQEIDFSLGGQPVHVTYDASSRVCSSVQSEPTVCQTVERTPPEGVRVARLDPTPGTGYVLRMLASTGVVFDDLPGEVTRLSVAMNTDLVMAAFTTAPACFHQTDPDGQTHTVMVAATQVDSGSGITAEASTETAC